MSIGAQGLAEASASSLAQFENKEVSFVFCTSLGNENEDTFISLAQFENKTVRLEADSFILRKKVGFAEYCPASFLRRMEDKFSIHFLILEGICNVLMSKKSPPAIF